MIKPFIKQFSKQTREKRLPRQDLIRSLHAVINKNALGEMNHYFSFPLIKK